MKHFKLRAATGLGLLLATALAQADAPAQTVVVTGRSDAAGLEALPGSADVLDAATLQQGQPRVSLAESLQRLPGIVALDRQNYAQDLQVSVRGFGARSTFGARGLRFVVDGLPATLPDGQAQVSHIDLGTAGRVEVLRGPFSALYGNAAGGVVAVFTEEAEGTSLGADVERGSFGLRREALKAMGSAEGLHYTLSAQHFATDGMREHSAATRELQNARLRLQPDDRSSIVLVANAVQLQAQDPLGLTRAQFEANPRQADASALRFDTRKSVDQAQFGVRYERRFDSGTASLQLYGGDRSTEQFQSIPTSAQKAATSPGGVIALSRSYSGLDLRWSARSELAGGPLEWAAGVASDGVREHRLGYENFIGGTLGVQGALRRDEHNSAASVDPYLQLQWQPAPRWSLLAGARSSTVRVKSNDAYVVPGNGDDSGQVRYRATHPALGASYRLSPAWQAYAAYGQGFETPTLSELAYRSTDGSDTGLNLGLRAARSRHLELGLKAHPLQGWRAQLAAFEVRTRDELTVQSSSGGRSVYQNAGRTLRTGVEAEIDGRFGAGWSTHLSVSTLRAVYRDAFCNGACANGSVPAGNRLPGAPTRTAYAELAWHSPAGAYAAAELRHVGPIPVDDRNSEAAAASTVAAVRLGVERPLGAWRWQAFVRGDNLADRRYAGSVIVNESNGRFFEPAPGRRWSAGMDARWHW